MIECPGHETRRSLSAFKNEKIEYDKPVRLYTFYFYRNELEDIGINIRFPSDFQDIYGRPFELIISPIDTETQEPDMVRPLLDIINNVIEVLCGLILLSLIFIEILFEMRKRRSC
jgi:hypothetical protein